MRFRWVPFLTAGLLATPGCGRKDTPVPAPPQQVPVQAGAVAADGAAGAPPAAGNVPVDGLVAPAAPDAAVGEPAAELGDGLEETRSLLEGDHFADAAFVKEACEHAVARAEVARAQVKAGGDALVAFDGIALALDTLDGTASLLFNVSPASDVRDAAEACTEAIAKVRSNVSLDHEVYEALVKVPREGLDEATIHFLNKTLRDFRLAGVSQDAPTRARVAEINEALTKLGQTYQKTVNADTRSVLLDPAELAGMPEDWSAKHPADAAGKVTVTTDYPDLIPFMTYATNAGARAKLQAQSGARGFPANAETLKQVLTLRAELAKLVGFPSFAALDLADKMAEKPETVEAFLKEARDAAKPRVERDLAELLARKKKDDPSATAVTVADRFYLQQLVRKEQYDFDAASVRPFFPYVAVRDGIFALYGELFGVSFKQREGAPVWHPTVEAWDLERDGVVIGRFFLDMHPRENKYKHAAMFPIQTGFTKAAGAPFDRIPWASLVCNFPNPAEGPALMEHTEVTTFFHEFGHLIHHLLAQRSRWLATSGINVEWDFVEAPSQLLEEWAWDPAVLARFAKDASGAAIPAETVAKMKRASEFGKGVELQRQLFYAAYSFYLHQADPATLDLEQWTSQLYADWSPYPRPEGDRLYANFAHLIGYKSAYYTYQWSLSIAKDLFERFKGKGLLDPGVAADYREHVLAPAGTVRAAKLVEDFLGRPHNLDAYRKWIVE